MTPSSLLLYMALSVTGPKDTTAIQVSQIEVIKDSFNFNGKPVSYVLKKPHGSGKMPAVFYMQGYGCFDVTRLLPSHPYSQVADHFAKNGFIVMLPNKPGLGYDTRKGCYELDFTAELAGFTAAYKQLISLPDVDTSRIIIFGHSMGGMEAPYIASVFKPKGVAVYGITIKSWYEYLLEMLRFQNPYLGIDYTQVDKEMKLYIPMLQKILIDGVSPGKIAQEDSTAKALLTRDFNFQKDNDFFGKDVIFSQSLQRMNHIEAWRKVSSKVFVGYGQYDIEAAGDFSHAELAKIINYYHPGNATYYSFPGTDHQFLELDSFQQAFDVTNDPVLLKKKRLNGANPMLLEKLLAWARAIIL